MAKTPKADSDTETADPEAAANRVVFVNPLSKGNLGKTTLYEYLVSALEESGIKWAGANMDNRHLGFQQAHPAQVTNHFDVEVKAVDEYQPVFSAIRRSTAPVYLVDQRAQADLAFLDAARRTGFLKICRQSGIRIVPVLVTLNDLDYIGNLAQTVQAFADEGITRWVVANHSTLHANDVFQRTPLMIKLRAGGSVVIDIPWYSKRAMAHLVGTNASVGGPYGFRDALQQPMFQEQSSSKYELEVNLLDMAKQFRNHADFLLPQGVEFTSLVGIDMGEKPEEQAQRTRNDLAGVSAAFMSE